ncbi:Structural maintenance of chromosomes protein 5 [Coemansia furcata]|nr:Structural maintenance of chromosomes protein 5 [Coemansia furcata]
MHGINNHVMSFAVLLQLQESVAEVQAELETKLAMCQQCLSVARISKRFRTMFNHINYLSEVILRKAGDDVISSSMEGEEGGAGMDDEDYDDWGIGIHVAFCHNEALDNHCQLSGKHAVSTILYLQALQSLIAASFYIIDEINQGMVKRNECLVHSLIVDSACQQGSSQYLLILPKLLPDLYHHPLMKVFCIFNGEWQPESFNFSKYISNACRSA